MAIPDRIARTVEIARPPAAVGAALTTAEGLGTWFGNSATIDLRAGGTAPIAWSTADKADLRIERVEEPTVFGFTWHVYGLPDDDPRRTYVEFTLEPLGAGNAADRRRVRVRPAARRRPPHGLRRQHQRLGERAGRPDRLPRCRLTRRGLTRR